MAPDGSSFTIVATFEALLRWQEDPTATRRRAVGEALAAVAEAIGARGVFLALDAAPLPELRIGSGTLTEQPEDAPLVADSGLKATATTAADGVTTPIRRIALRVDSRTVPVGSIWLDSPVLDPAPAIRALELALGAAVSRAELRQTADRLEALDAATRGIAGTFALESVLQLIVDRVRDLVGAQYAALGIVDDAGDMEWFVTSGISAAQRRAIGPLPRGRGLLGLIVRENRAYRIPDIALDPDSVGFPPNHPAMTSFLGVPINIKGHSVGNFYLTNKQGTAEFAESDQHIVEMFALHAGVAIENARLHEQVEQIAVVDERERIGRDLHDGIIQSLYAVGLSLEDVPELMLEDRAEAAARVDRAIDALNLTITNIRNFIFGLRPELADRHTLVGGLAAIADGVRLNSMIDVELLTDQAVVFDLRPAQRAELLQIAREAVSNLARHSRATQASLTVEQEGLELVLEIADNGQGFDAEAARSGAHQGLANMRARAEDLGGTLKVDTAPGQGTRIIVRVPMAPGATDSPTGPAQESRP